MEESRNLVPELFEIGYELSRNPAGRDRSLDCDAVVNWRIKASDLETGLFRSLLTDAPHLLPIKLRLLSHDATVRFGLVDENSDFRNREWRYAHLQGVQ